MIITLGNKGCLVVTPDFAQHVGVQPVQAADTTGAGDAFVGSLAYLLAAGRSLPEAAERANRIAAISVQNRGTQTSFPTASDLPAGLLD